MAQLRLWMVLLTWLCLAGCGGSSGRAPGEAAPAYRQGPRIATDTTTMSLRPGWNGVAFRCPQVEALAERPEIPGMAWFDGSTYHLSPVTAAEVNRGQGGRRGVWMFATTATSLTYSGPPAPEGRLDLHSGWNLISLAGAGPVPGGALQAQVQGTAVPLGSVVLPVFTRVDSDNTYHSVDVTAGGTLLPDRPYWVFAGSAVALIWQAPEPGTSPSPAPSATASPGATAAASLRFSSVPGLVSAGGSFTVQVEVLNLQGARVAAAGNVQLTAPEGHPLTGSLQAAVSSGVATFSGLGLTRSGTVQLTARFSSLTATSPSLVVQAGPPATLVFLEQPANGTAGVAVNPTVRLVFRDAHGNDVIPNVPVPVTLNSSAADATLLNKVATTDPTTGVASFGSLRQDTAGTGYTLTASVGSFTSLPSQPFTVSPASASTLAFVPPTPGSLVAGTGTTVVVEVRDPFGNLDPTATNSVTLEIGAAPATPGQADLDTAGAGVQTSLTSSASGGQASFAVSPNNAGNWTLEASAAGVVVNPTREFTVGPGAAASLDFVPSAPTSGPLGSAVDAFDLAVRDALGNDLSAGGSVILDNGSGAGALSGNSTVLGSPTPGRATFSSLTLTPAGADSPSVTQTLTAHFAALTRSVAFTFKQLGEFRVASTTLGNQLSFPFGRNLARAADGRFVVVWLTSSGVFARRFDPLGVPQGAEFQVHTTVGPTKGHPGVAMDSSGNFVVVWTSDLQDGSSSGIYAQRYNAAGEPQGGEFRVNTTTLGDQSSPAVATSAAGDFVVTWSGPGTSLDIFAQRYSAAGLAQGGEFLVNTEAAGDQSSPAVACDAAGNFVVAWRSEGQDGDGAGVYAQRFNAAGSAQGSEFRVNTHTPGNQSDPDLRLAANGDFVVTWTSDGQDGDGPGIYAHRFQADGTAQGSEFRVNTQTAGAQDQPAVSVDGDGNFLVAWTSAGSDGSGLGIKAQRYSAVGTAQGGEFQVNVQTNDHQTGPAVAADGSGDVVITWSSNGQDGSGYGIYARRYRGDGSVGP